MMTRYIFEPNDFHNTFGGHKPVLSVLSGDEISTSIVDAHGRDGKGRILAHSPNPLTGPFYIQNAALGDSLVIELQKLHPNRMDGWSYDVMKSHLLEPALAAKLPERSMLEWMIDPKKGTVSPTKNQIYPPLPLRPVLGCIGVAPALGESITSYTCGNFGGNMDYQGIVEGVNITLPVFVEGALLFIGDGHALQSSGEITGSGVETSFDVEFKVELKKNHLVHWPRIEDERYIITIGNAQPLEKAIQVATSEMILWLGEEWAMDFLESNILMSQVVEYEPGNLVSREYTIACKIPKKILPGKRHEI